MAHTYSITYYDSVLLIPYLSIKMNNVLRFILYLLIESRLTHNIINDIII